MSPHDVEVLFHHYYSPTGTPWRHGKSPAYLESLRWAYDNGLLDRGDELAIATPKGHAMVAMICATPIPKQAFVDPRTGEQFNAP